MPEYLLMVSIKTKLGVKLQIISIGEYQIKTFQRIGQGLHTLGKTNYYLFAVNDCFQNQIALQYPSSLKELTTGLNMGFFVLHLFSIA